MLKACLRYVIDWARVSWMMWYCTLRYGLDYVPTKQSGNGKGPPSENTMRRVFKKFHCFNFNNGNVLVMSFEITKRRSTGCLKL